MNRTLNKQIKKKKKKKTRVIILQKCGGSRCFQRQGRVVGYITTDGQGHCVSIYVYVRMYVLCIELRCDDGGGKNTRSKLRSYVLPVVTTTARVCFQIWRRSEYRVSSCAIIYICLYQTRHKIINILNIINTFCLSKYRQSLFIFDCY